MKPAVHQLRADGGFTLLEILIVVFLIGLMSTVLSIRVLDRSGLPGAAKVIAAELRYTAQRAIASGEVHRLSLDLVEQRFRVEHRTKKQPEADARLPSSPALLNLRPPVELTDFEPIPDQQGAWRELRETDVVLESVLIGDVEITDDTAFVGFAGEGGADPALIRLVDDNGATIQVRVLPFTGEVRIEDGDE